MLDSSTIALLAPYAKLPNADVYGCAHVNTLIWADTTISNVVWRAKLAWEDTAVNNAACNRSRCCFANSFHVPGPFGKSNVPDYYFNL